MAKTKKQLGRKRRVRGGGLWEDFTGLFRNKPQPDPTKPELKLPEQSIKKADEVVADTVQEGAESVGVPAPPSEDGVPGDKTKPEEANLLGGRRRKTRKSKKSRRRH
jgi:hypothetical protein